MPAPVVAPAVRPAKALAVSLAVVPRVAVKLSPPTARLSPACKATKVCVAVSVTAAMAALPCVMVRLTTPEPTFTRSVTFPVSVDVASTEFDSPVDEKVTLATEPATRASAGKTPVFVRVVRGVVKKVAKSFAVIPEAPATIVRPPRLIDSPTVKLEKVNCVISLVAKAAT